jgi:hypothetical protein
MANVKKGILVSPREWWKHLRPYMKREFWKRQRKAEKHDIKRMKERDGRRA